LDKKDNIWAGSQAGVYLSNDNGDSWLKLSGGIPSQIIPSIVINDANEFVFAATSYFGVYRSEDYGETWQQANNGLPYLRMKSLAINSNGHIFAGTLKTKENGGGVFVSYDNGDNWHSFDQGLSEATVQTLVNGWEGQILAGTDAGVYKHAQTVTSINEDAPSIPSSFVLQQNYPNPFNPTTVINYQLKVAGNVKLTIYNQLGEEVRSLVNAKQAPSYYQIEWNGLNNSGERVTSGIYLYRLEADTIIQTRKMLLLR